MKKNMMMILILAIAGVASAEGLVEDWEGTTMTRDGTLRAGSNVGWFSGNARIWESIETSGGNPTSFVELHDEYSTGAVGRWFDASTLGLTDGEAYKLRFDLKVVGSGANMADNSFRIAVGHNIGTATAYLTEISIGASTAGIVLGGATTAAAFDIDNETMVVTSAQDWTTVTTTGSFTYDVANTYLFIGFQSYRVLVDEAVQIDNVTITDGSPPPSSGSVFILR